MVNTLELDEDQKRPQPMLLNLGAIAIADHVVACTQAFNHKSPTGYLMEHFTREVTEFSKIISPYISFQSHSD